METPDKPRPCIECGGQTRAICIIDRGYYNIQYELVYAKAVQGIFGKEYYVEGTVGAELCENCGRITLRAVPKK